MPGTGSSGVRVEWNVHGKIRLDYALNKRSTSNLFETLPAHIPETAVQPEKVLPDQKLLSDIHRIAFDIHMELLETYGLNTDIVFSRPNYCKIDLMVDNNRGDNLFMQENELDMLKERLSSHGITDGLQGLLDISEKAGKKYGIQVKPTCDAKYLEVGISSKSDNADSIFTYLQEQYQIRPEDCSFWGDEYVGIEEGIFGSDSFMRTEKTKAGDFFDVSEVPGKSPDGVKQLGGGVNQFLNFLKEQCE